MTGVKWYGEGLFVREVVKGGEMSANYVYPLVPAAFIYNRLFAWKGSFAVVPVGIGDQYVSSEFPQFIPDQGSVLAEYLYLFCMSKKMISAVNHASVGSAAVSRNRFKEEEFLNMHMPLPPLEVQRAIVQKWEDLLAEIERLNRLADELELGAANAFLKRLGLSTPTATIYKKTMALRWSDFDRWGVDTNFKRLSSMNLESGIYPVVQLGDIVTRIQYGTSEKANTEGKGVPVLRMNNIKDGMLELKDLKHLELSEEAICSLRLSNGDILIIRTNGSKELVGTCGVFHASGEYVFASYLIRACINSTLASPDFVAYILNSAVGRHQIDAISRKIMQHNINSEELRGLKIPIPPLEIQRNMIHIVLEARQEALSKRQEVEELKARTVDAIETAIVGAEGSAGLL